MSHTCPQKIDTCRDFHTLTKEAAILSCRSCCKAFFKNLARETLKEATR